ncbi:hypothetical protein AGABI1DRAFT_131561 [Agaricus bisporus var. burnettii JB137-S8]|uniref:Rap-GAP domain-containing protein n=1 Tax=Agaricus bisporus var. burnettii (strain JB137-S8 / ATCC MYA-4627 / FGSC 10392) TaxID=597362 RepID=K5XNL5_AGABU|nr:uncharacterized protein AGABI1DRAFT_131561 [Agaricus bisporus var. burnettii JB137-S8]EKM76245.1 hypothetical protein AGABI1DRAFT_131561 [Agaricus bisporus var. burnettii JB137-S8]
MSPQQQDVSGFGRPRQRANTTSFASSFGWRRHKSDNVSPSPVGTPQASHQPTLSLSAIIDALRPPAVPSLAHARTLAALLSTASPLPRCAAVQPIISSLCDFNNPPSLQAIGFDVLSSYWENPEAGYAETADRLSFFSLFLGPTTAWAVDLWEPRFKALRALTKYGTDIVGVEAVLINLLKHWLKGAFDGLLDLNGELYRSERVERERSVDVLFKFLSDVLNRTENIARLPENTVHLTIEFYASLVDHSIVAQKGSEVSSDSPIVSDPSPSQQSFGLHRRNTSSLSTSSITSPSTPTVPSTHQTLNKPPAELAITIYLDYLSTQIKTLSPSLIENIIPLLFRALAFCASPLPRLTILSQPLRKPSLEDRVLETLVSIYTGPYSTTCVGMHRRCLLPAFPAEGEIETEEGEPIMMKGDDITPQKISRVPLQIGLLTSLGGYRMMRMRLRQLLIIRLARAYISREVSYSYTGAPSHLELEQELMEKAWPRDDYLPNADIGIGSVANGWDPRRVGTAVSESVCAWIDWIGEGPHTPGITPTDKDAFRENWDRERNQVDKILEEAAGMLKDLLQEADSREEDNPCLNDEEAAFVGGILYNLYGSPYVLPLDNPISAPTPLLKSITSLLARDHTSNLNPLLSTTLISIVEHLTDTDTARLPGLMLDQHDLTPTSPEWLLNWENLLGNSIALSSQRPLTKSAAMEALAIVYDTVKDMASYRRPLADLVLKFCKKWVGAPEIESEDGDPLWKVLGEEIVLQAIESSDGETDDINAIIELLTTVASEPSVEEAADKADAHSALGESQVPSPSIGTSIPSASNLVSPILSRMQSEFHIGGKDKEKESAIPSVMSLLSSFTSGNVSRSQSTQPTITEDLPDVVAEPEKSKSLPRVVSAVAALVDAFAQISFTSYVLEGHLHRLAIRLYHILLEILAQGQSARGRVTVLQFLMRLRADIDHNIFFIFKTYDRDGLVSRLSSLIGRSSLPTTERHIEDPEGDYSDTRKSRPKFQEQEEKVQSGFGIGRLSRSTGSRSRSRAPLRTSSVEITRKPRMPLWNHPEVYPFVVADSDSASEALISYNPNGPNDLVLSIDQYLKVIIGILERETSWDVLSYVLCHLPTQLANKHLFCGPLCSQLISRLLNVLCTGILKGELGFYIEAWPPGLKPRDAQGLAYHTLSVLQGLDGQLSTIKSCLHALTLSAFELRISVTKCLPRILEKLSQIMSNPNMSVHILGFLTIVGTIPALYANFTEADYKMVFGVALQYLQHYNRQNASPTVSWALSQYVRIMSYTTVYVWFLALKLPDRPKHIPYITRQLLLANEAKKEIDIPTEVCFDWLARNAFASADPRPANSAFSEIVMNPANHPSDPSPSGPVQSGKSWLVGNAVVTIRTLPRAGWVEILSRRSSGFSKLICHIENVPMVGPGEVSPDIVSVPAGLMLGKTPTRVASATGAIEEDVEQASGDKLQEALVPQTVDDSSEPPRPDPITGYVWSKSAPSQRRKDVTLDPSYVALQLSSYPFGNNNARKVEDSPVLQRFLSTLDRIPVIDTHKVGIMYVAPGQTDELEILGNTHGSPAYTHFLEGLGRLVNLRGQVDVYAGGLNPDEDGEYAYAWWDDIGQILYHTATMMPSHAHDPHFNFKKRHIGNDYVRIVWNDSGGSYRFDTLTTQFQFVNIVIEPHSVGAIAAFSSLNDNDYFKVTIQQAPGMTEFAPVGFFKLISAENLPLLVRQLSLLADWFASVFAETQKDTARVEVTTNWSARLQAIRRFMAQLPEHDKVEPLEGIFSQESSRDFTNTF